MQPPSRTAIASRCASENNRRLAPRSSGWRRAAGPEEFEERAIAGPGERSGERGLCVGDEKRAGLLEKQRDLLFEKTGGIPHTFIVAPPSDIAFVEESLIGWMFFLHRKPADDLSTARGNGTDCASRTIRIGRRAAPDDSDRR